MSMKNDIIGNRTRGLWRSVATNCATARPSHWGWRSLETRTAGGKLQSADRTSGSRAEVCCSRPHDMPGIAFVSSQGQNKHTASASLTASAPGNEVPTCTSPPLLSGKHTLTLFLFLSLLLFPILSHRISKWCIWVYLLAYTPYDSGHGEITYHW